jgi:hypothetical protein
VSINSFAGRSGPLAPNRGIQVKYDLTELTFSRREFLVTGTAVAVATAVPATAGSPLGRREILIASGELHHELPFGFTSLMLRGERLARLQELRRCLRTVKPRRVLLQLDATDRLLFDVAAAEVADSVIEECDTRCLLVYRDSMFARTEP